MFELEIPGIRTTPAPSHQLFEQAVIAAWHQGADVTSIRGGQIEESAGHIARDVEGFYSSWRRAKLAARPQLALEELSPTKNSLDRELARTSPSAFKIVESFISANFGP